MCIRDRANKGHQVTIVEMMDKIAAGESTTVLPLMMKDFADHNVKQLVLSLIHILYRC